MFRRVSRRTVLASIVGFSAVTSVTAASFSVSPVRATLSAAKPTEALAIYNSGSEPAVVQLDVRAWSQDHGTDVLTSTREILATPPIFTVAPGSKQVVRVGARRSPDSTRELAYRLFLQEVPPPPKPGFQGLRMALRLSIPVFIVPASAVPKLRWRAALESRGQLRIAIDNSGDAHVQIANFSLVQSGRAVLNKYQVAAYVLAQQSRQWIVVPTGQVTPGSALHVSAETDVGPVEADVAIESP